MSLDVNLNWDSVDEPHDEYRIYRSTSSPTDTTSGNKVGTTQSGTTTYTDPVPEEEATYYYVVTAVRVESTGDYESVSSEEISVYIPTQAVGKIRSNGSISELTNNKVQINGSVVEIQNAKARINGSIVELI